MKKSIFIWTPRILTILYILFISMFAMDMWGQWIGLLIHLIPSFVLVGLLALAWKRPKIGGYAFALLAILFGFQFNGFKEWMQFLILILPLLVTSGLFFVAPLDE